MTMSHYPLLVKEDRKKREPEYENGNLPNLNTFVS